MIKYFESVEEAEKWLKENEIEKYVMYTPDYFEKGVEVEF